LGSSEAAGNLRLTTSITFPGRDPYRGDRTPYEGTPATTMSSPTPTTEADRPESAGVHSLWRLRGYLRPHLAQLVIMLSTALVGVGLSIAIPLVIKAVIDGPIAERDLDPILPLGLLALGLGVLEAVLVFWRRWVQSTAVLSIETQMRNDLYERLQQLPMAFHGKWHSGQLLSRVTTDLSSIRRFFGFGMLFLVINVLQLTTVTILLLAMYWPLGLVVAVAAVPIVVLSNRFESKYVVISRQVQDEQGDLATLAEEGAVGIRVIKSFGRSEHVAQNYERAAGKLYGTSMDKVRVSAKFWTFL
jgi:ATP-binding cassette, subfamily B, bacterial